VFAFILGICGPRFTNWRQTRSKSTAKPGQSVGKSQKSIDEAHSHKVQFAQRLSVAAQDFRTTNTLRVKGCIYFMNVSTGSEEIQRSQQSA